MLYNCRYRTLCHENSTSLIGDRSLKLTKLRLLRDNHPGEIVQNPNFIHSKGLPSGITFFPNNFSDYLKCFPSGYIEHHSLHGKARSPRKYFVHEPNQNTSSKLHITNIQFSPFNADIFLVGSDDCSICIFHKSLSLPLNRWYGWYLSSEEGISSRQSRISMEIFWSPFKSSVFFAIIDSHIFLFDVAVNEHGPILDQKIDLRVECSGNRMRKQILFDPMNRMLLFSPSDPSNVFCEMKLSQQHMSDFSTDFDGRLSLLETYVREKMT